MLNRNKAIFNHKGVTLVELLVSLSLVGMVVLLLYGVLFYGLRSFNLGNEQADVQYDVRRKANVIVDTLRMSDISSTAETGYTKMEISDYFDLTNLYDDAEILFTSKEEGKIIELSIYAEKNGKSYRLVQDIYLNNYKSTFPSDLSNATFLFYKPYDLSFSNDETTAPDETLVAPTSIEIYNDTGAVSLNYNDSLQFYATVAPEGANTEVNWNLLVNQVNGEEGEIGHIGIKTGLLTTLQNKNGTVSVVATSIDGTVVSDVYVVDIFAISAPEIVGFVGDYTKISPNSDWTGNFNITGGIPSYSVSSFNLFNMNEPVLTINEYDTLNVSFKSPTGNIKNYGFTIKITDANGNYSNDYIFNFSSN
ncbi:MAG: prepilin-type N-terminal cleavage/methylation domain-containing protein [Tissierellales bacterium]|nr:prepilin-type N-terminal cleavage/methylation domain-containing protein [Tissierellales bacterium]MBN2826878.1 prepilin-type N-terminal cleavage/methylation domain-containing protein [Tissierellales bacterium]